MTIDAPQGAQFSTVFLQCGHFFANDDSLNNKWNASKTSNLLFHCFQPHEASGHLSFLVPEVLGPTSRNLFVESGKIKVLKNF